MISCILLAAGLSQRFGSPKALANLNNQRVIQHIQKTLLVSSCDEIIIVLGAEATAIEPYVFNHKRIRIVYNKDYNLGQTASVQAGVREANSSTNGLMFWPVDCPLISLLTVETLIEEFNNAPADILIPSYQEKRGHPPIFNQSLRAKILNLPLTQGLNSLFAEHPPQSLAIDDPGITKSFNTPEEFDAIKKPRL